MGSAHNVASGQWLIDYKIGRTDGSTIRPMRDDARGRRRAKVGITVDPVLLSAVDLYVQRRQGLDRGKVMETALQDWYRARQQAEMIEQFTGPDQVDEIEMRDWRHIRRAAASRKLKRPGR